MKGKAVDILIIGAGASGAAAAWNLSKTNYKVLCFEQGPFVKKKSYSNLQPKWEKVKQKEFNVNPNIRQLDSDYPIDDKNSPISIANYNAVGGSTILYSGHFPRFHTSDFKTKTNSVKDIVNLICSESEIPKKIIYNYCLSLKR